MRSKVILSALAVLTVVGMVAIAGTGNGAPNGAHENINIIGAPRDKNANCDGGNGSVIFVDRTGSTSFYVHGGSSFQILDHDGTDGHVGSSLTDPGLVFPYDGAASPTWRVQIWVRLLGPKGSEVRWTSYYYDEVGDTYVLWDQFTLDKSSKFTEKTGSLLADGYQDMLWTLDQKTKFRICQMRIFLLDD